MNLHGTLTLLLIVLTMSLSRHVVLAQRHHVADSLLKVALGQDYEVGGVFDVDRVLAKPKVDPSVAYIREDPNHQLSHTLIVLYAKWDSMPPQHRYGSGASTGDCGGIALLRDGKVTWYSNRFIARYSPLTCDVSGFADLDNDGVTDIIISVFEGERHENETLWLIAPNDHGGRILNAVDRHGDSEISGDAGSFRFTNSRTGKTKQIRSGRDVYSWNGSVFAVPTGKSGHVRK